MLNSHAMTEAISPFNPKGDFGERHIHTLPYRMMPPYDPFNDDHIRIGALARDIAKAAQAIIKSDAYLNDPSRALPARRRKLRERPDLLQFQQLASTATSLGTTAFGDEAEGDGEDSGEAGLIFRWQPCPTKSAMRWLGCLRFLRHGIESVHSLTDATRTVTIRNREKAESSLPRPFHDPDCSCAGILADRPNTLGARGCSERHRRSADAKTSEGA